MDTNLIGRSIQGRYRITRQLGRGGAGITFLAEDLQCFSMPCVVKQLKPRSNHPKTLSVARRLFAREAEILNTLGHCDRIPRLLAYFESEGDFFLVQELIEGEDLSREIIADCPWSEVQTIALLTDILEVLSVIQQHGVIHRDLKPSNLMRRTRDGKIVAIDFGSVKQVSSQIIDSSGQIKHTIAVGTRSYMPTEQLMGHPGFYSDIYAVGVIAIQALTGVPPRQLPVDNDGELIWRDCLRNNDRYNPLFLKLLDKMVCHQFQERYTWAENVLLELEKLSNKKNSERTTLAINTAKQQPQLIDRTKIIPAVAGKISKPPQKTKPKSKLTLIFSFFAAIAAALIIWGFWRYQDSRTIPLIPYSDREQGFAIVYPQTWTQQNRDDFVAVGVIFVSTPETETDNFQETVSVLIENLSTDMSLDEYTDKSILEIQTLSDPAVTFPKPVTLGQNEAKTVIYQGEENGVRVKRMQTWTVEQDRAYIVTYTAAPEKYNFYLPVVNKMLDSFKLVNRPTNK
ncbi:serine/threonine-protein kinase [Myxosarcina sp. GI1]|uniref:serine/threonine-protein kinase n=1 Tax=Myxosarcina sp. GI1 TaxID=1541065 RepID=UPI00056BE667|nr:serine/threonine-protein kinase [Myxosarcina sp. GI1]